MRKVSICRNFDHFLLAVSAILRYPECCPESCRHESFNPTAEITCYLHSSPPPAVLIQLWLMLFVETFSIRKTKLQPNQVACTACTASAAQLYRQSEPSYNRWLRPLCSSSALTRPSSHQTFTISYTVEPTSSPPLATINHAGYN